MATAKETALFLASHGFPVFPVKAGYKTPATLHGCQDAKSTPEEVEAMWGNANYNVGLATGTLTGNSIPRGTYSRVIVFDDDAAKHPGKVSLIDQYEEMSGIRIGANTVQYQTGGGGHSYVFRDESALIETGGASAKFAFDVRANGHYSVIPESFLFDSATDGRYTWITSPFDTDIAPITDAELDFYNFWRANKSDTSASNTGGHVSNAGGEFEPLRLSEMIDAGERNDKLFRLASSLITQGLPENMIVDICYLLRDHQMVNGYEVSDLELERTVQGVINRYETGDSSWITENTSVYNVQMFSTFLIKRGLCPAAVWGGIVALNGILPEALSETNLKTIYNRHITTLRAGKRYLVTK